MSTPSLDPYLLKAFLAVADQRSFTRAAATLNRTQSAVSSQIKRLEGQLGAALFSRSTSKVELTLAGESLAGYARQILRLSDEAVRRLREHDVEGRVRLGVMDDYAAIILPPILKIFSSAYPGIELEIETGLTSKMTDHTGSAFDIVIAMHGPCEKTGELLCFEQAVWAGSAAINAKELDPLPLALYPAGCLFRRWSLDALDRIGRRWRLVFVSHSLAAVEAIAAQGLAITVVKTGTLPRSLRVLDQEDGLPDLPRAVIRMHCAPSLSAAGSLLASHLRVHLSPPR